MTITDALDIIQIIALAIQSVAIIIAGFWAYSTFVLKRGQFPRANISLDIHHIPISKSRNILRVSVVFQNKGEVLISLSRAEIWIQQVIPCPSLILDDILKGNPPKLNGTELEWPLLAERCVVRKGTKRRAGEESCIEWGQQEVEPGESGDYHFDFVIEDTVKTILIYVHFENTAKQNIFWFFRRYKKPFGWSTTCLYNLKKPEPVVLEL